MIFKRYLKLLKSAEKYNIINGKADKVLLSLFIICMCILIVSQVGLSNKTTRTFFTNIDEYEGINVNEIDNMFSHGSITLKIVDINPSDNIKILLNGDEVAKFNSDTVTIDVGNNSLLEINAVNTKLPFRVKIVDVSENISTECTGKEIVVDRNIAVLTRIFLK